MISCPEWRRAIEDLAAASTWEAQKRGQEIDQTGADLMRFRVESYVMKAMAVYARAGLGQDGCGKGCVCRHASIVSVASQTVAPLLGADPEIFFQNEMRYLNNYLKSVS